MRKQFSAKKAVKICILTSTLFLATACSKAIETDGPQQTASKATIDENPPTATATPSPTTSPAPSPDASPTPTPKPVACDPFQDQFEAGPNNGLHAKLYKLPKGKSFATIEEFFDRSTEIDADLFLSKIKTYTRQFDTGFKLTNGEILKDNDGKILTEYFGFKARAKIRLIPGENRSGLKQFALISDDGAVLRVGKSSEIKELIDSRKDLEALVGKRTTPNHPTKMSCAHEGVWMNIFEDLPIELDYFQGPRNHIAFILLWRDITDIDNDGEIDSDEDGIPLYDLKDPACKFLPSNDLFFNWKVPAGKPSIPNERYKDLIKRGWKVVPSRNILLPDEHQVNPCTK